MTWKLARRSFLYPEMGTITAFFALMNTLNRFVAVEVQFKASWILHCPQEHLNSNGLSNSVGNEVVLFKCAQLTHEYKRKVLPNQAGSFFSPEK